MKTFFDGCYRLLDRTLRALPDLRAWVATGLFGLTVMVFSMIWASPKLTENQGFMFLAQAVVVSGLINAVVAFLFTSSKSSAEIRDQMGRVIDKIAEPAVQPPPGSATVTVNPPAEVQVSAAAAEPSPATPPQSRRPHTLPPVVPPPE